MSRVANKPVLIPSSVTLDIKNNILYISGDKGKTEYTINNKHVSYDYENSKLFVKPLHDSKRLKSLCGLYKSHIHNIIIGVTQGYCKIMEISGVGYRATVNEKFKFLTLSIGLSHEVVLKIPEDISVVCQRNVISITGIDKQKVGMFAAKLFDLKRPEPYKASGISYQGMYILRKTRKA